jgi:hypothetical protein
MKLFVFGKPGSTYMKIIRKYVNGWLPNWRESYDGALNYGLQGGKLSDYLSRNPRVAHLPILNRTQHGNKHQDCEAVTNALETNQIDACHVPAISKIPGSASHGWYVPTDGTWILKPYWSFGGRNIVPYTGNESIGNRYYQQRVPKRRYEMRVHAWKWVDPQHWIFQKKTHEGGEEQLTWNHHTGGKFNTVREPYDPLHDRMREFTSLIMDTLGYQFGACDFIISNPGERGVPLKTWFIEWNLAPGWVLKHCRNAYKKYSLALEELTPEQFKNLLTDNEPDIVSTREPVYNVWG